MTCFYYLDGTQISDGCASLWCACGWIMLVEVVYHESKRCELHYTAI